MRGIVSASQTTSSTWAHLRRHELGRSAKRGRRASEPHVLLAQSVIGDLDVTVEGKKNVVELEIPGEADIYDNVSLGRRERDGHAKDRDEPVDDAVLVKVLEGEEDFGGVELGAPRGELFPLDMKHKISTRDVLHDKVDPGLGLEARVKAQEERMPLAGGGEEDALLRFRAEEGTVKGRRNRKEKPVDVSTFPPRRSQ